MPEPLERHDEKKKSVRRYFDKKEREKIITDVLREYGEIRANELFERVWERQEKNWEEESMSHKEKYKSDSKSGKQTINATLNTMIDNGIVIQNRQSHKYVTYRLIETVLFEIKLKEIVQRLHALVSNREDLRKMFIEYLKIARIRFYSIKPKIINATNKQERERLEREAYRKTLKECLDACKGQTLVNELVKISNELQDATTKIYLDLLVNSRSVGQGHLTNNNHV